MLGYEDYLKKYPSVSRNRAEKLKSDGVCYFLKEEHVDWALLPGNGFSDHLVEVNLTNSVCHCNVFRTKRACPHIAAALGIIEKNGGKIPYTDPVSHTYACLERLTRSTDTVSRIPAILFLRDASPFLSRLPREKKPEFLLALALSFQNSSFLTPDDFRRCFEELIRGDRRSAAPMADLLYENRKSCMKAVGALIGESYLDPFSDRKKDTILKEIAADENLTRLLLPDLYFDYASYFSRGQLLKYVISQKKNLPPPVFLSELLNRLILEEPPCYDAFLQLCDRIENPELLEPAPEALRRLAEAGYGDRLGKVAVGAVARIRNLKDYDQLIQILPHDQFLAAWKRVLAERYRYRSAAAHRDWELEISLLEDPDADPDDYELETLSCHTLHIILKTRPSCREEVNQAARKIYRRAVKEKKRKLAAEALMVLLHGQDPIAAKYASGWDFGEPPGEDLVYLTAVGVHFDCLEKVVPDLKKMEVPHAAGQDQ